MERFLNNTEKQKSKKPEKPERKDSELGEDGLADRGKREFLKKTGVFLGALATGSLNSFSTEAQDGNLSGKDGADIELEPAPELNEKLDEYRNYLEQVKQRGIEAVFESEGDFLLNLEVMESLQEHAKNKYLEEPNWSGYSTENGYVKGYGQALQEVVHNETAVYNEASPYFDQGEVPDWFYCLPVQESKASADLDGPGGLGAWGIDSNQDVYANEINSGATESEIRGLVSGASLAGKITSEKIDIYGEELAIFSYNGSFVGSFREQLREESWSNFWEKFQQEESFREQITQGDNSRGIGYRWGLLNRVGEERKPLIEEQIKKDFFYLMDTGDDRFSSIVNKIKEGLTLDNFLDFIQEKVKTGGEYWGSERTQKGLSINLEYYSKIKALEDLKRESEEA